MQVGHAGASKKWTYYEQSTSRMERIFKCKLSISSSQVSKGHPQVTIPECCLISCLIQSDALNRNLKVPKFLNNLHELCTHTHPNTHTQGYTHQKVQPWSLHCCSSLHSCPPQKLAQLSWCSPQSWSLHCFCIFVTLHMLSWNAAFIHRSWRASLQKMGFKSVQLY